MSYNLTVPLILIRIMGFMLGLIGIRVLWQFLAPKGKVRDAVVAVIVAGLVVAFLVDAANHGSSITWIMAKIGQFMSDPLTFVNSLLIPLLLALIAATVLYDIFLKAGHLGEYILTMVGAFIVIVLYDAMRNPTSLIYVAFADLLNSLIGMR